MSLGCSTKSTTAVTVGASSSPATTNAPGVINLWVAASSRNAELRRLDAEGNWSATLKVLDTMAADGDVDAAIDHARVRAEMGDQLTGARLAKLLSDAGREDELRALAAKDPWHASGT